MKYDTKNELEVQRMRVRMEALIKQEKLVDLKACNRARSIKQNAYLHVVITLYAIEFGHTKNEAKTDLKRACHFMVYEKNGKHYLKETSKMDSKELTEFIEWIRNMAAQNGCYIPTSDEYLQNKYAIDYDIEKHKQYL